MHDANTISRTAPCFQPPRFKKIYRGMILRISDGCFSSKCQRLPQVFRLRESSGSIYFQTWQMSATVSQCLCSHYFQLAGWLYRVYWTRTHHARCSPNANSLSRYTARQEAQLSPRDRAMRRVSWSLANCHATVQKLLVRQVLNQVSAVDSWPVRQNRAVDSASVR